MFRKDIQEAVENLSSFFAQKGYHKSHLNKVKYIQIGLSQFKMAFRIQKMAGEIRNDEKVHARVHFADVFSSDLPLSKGVSKI